MKEILGTQYFTADEVADAFGAKRATVWKWVRTGKINGRKFGREYLFTRDEVEAFFVGRTQPRG